ncbi:MAG: DMT family transporter [Silicimonas sp.]|nr:DMT family transporter [Silicimonas sp.]
MTLTDAERRTPVGALWALLAVVCFSTNDVLVKFLSSGYPLYQLMFIRTLFAMAFILAVLVPMTGGLGALRTRRLVTHLIRGLCVVFANFCFFLGLAALPLAEAVAIFFISPLAVSVFAVVFLGETVGPRRWAAIAFGLLGVIIVLRPGTEAFQVAALMPLLAALGYATLHTMTRRIGTTENATAMAFYIQVSFVLVSGVAGIAFGNGQFETFDHPSMEFLFRAWVWPAGFDLALIALLGVTSALGGFSISNAYRRSEAAYVAPFEYAAMPLAVVWGLAVFGEWPDLFAWLGIALILASGLVLIWRETLANNRARVAPKRL